MKQTIDDLLANHPAWTVSGETLVGNWKFNDFAALRAVVTQVCDLADELNHHPTVTYGYNTLRIETTTHDAGNKITQKDVELAGRVSELVG
jgi:4a-hydroxytetrahydrobiopterin dehydratase